MIYHSNSEKVINQIRSDYFFVILYTINPYKNCTSKENVIQFEKKKWNKENHVYIHLQKNPKNWNSIETKKKEKKRKRWKMMNYGI